MKVVIGQGYHLTLDAKLWKEMKPYPPLGALYAAGTVRAAGHEVIFHDAMLASGTAEWSQLLETSDASVAVLYEDNFNYLTKMCLGKMREAALKMVTAARRRDMIVIVCGSDATDEPEVYHAAGAHYVVRGEGEQTLTDILDTIEAGAQHTPIALDGASIRVANLTRQGAPRPQIRHLDALPMPAWDLVDLARYRRIWLTRHGYYSINLATSRGCPYHCTWCAKPIWGQTYHARHPGAVAEEIATLKTLVPFEHIWFTDDIFGLRRGWIDDFGKALNAREVGIRYKCLGRADLLLREGEIAALAASGCETVWIGAESGSQQVLDNMQKGTTVAQNLDVAARLHDAGIKVGYFIQFGYPGEGWCDIAATFRLVANALPDDLGISVAYPLPGTVFMAEVQSHLLGTHWQDSDDLSMLYEGPFPTRFYRLLHRQLHDWFAFLHVVSGRGTRTLRAPRRTFKAARLAVRLAARAMLLLIFQFASHGRSPDFPASLSRDEAASPSEDPA